LTIGCHGPGAPPGIFEGIATTKGFTTYYSVPDPVPGVDAGRTFVYRGGTWAVLYVWDGDAPLRSTARGS